MSTFWNSRNFATSTSTLSSAHHHSSEGAQKKMFKFDLATNPSEDGLQQLGRKDEELQSVPKGRGAASRAGNSAKGRVVVPGPR